LKKYIIFVIVAVNFILFLNLGIKYIYSQETDVSTPKSLNQTMIREGNGNLESLNDTKHVSEVLTPDSINESSFSDNEKYGSGKNSTNVSEVLTPIQ